MMFESFDGVHADMRGGLAKVTKNHQIIVRMASTTPNEQRIDHHGCSRE